MENRLVRKRIHWSGLTPRSKVCQNSADADFVEARVITGWQRPRSPYTASFAAYLEPANTQLALLWQECSSRVRELGPSLADHDAVIAIRDDPQA